LLTETPANYKVLYWLRCHPFFTRETESKGVDIRFPLASYINGGELTKKSIGVSVWDKDDDGLYGDIRKLLESDEFKKFGVK